MSVCMCVRMSGKVKGVKVFFPVGRPPETAVMSLQWRN